MQDWIFVISEDETVFKNRIAEQKWPIFQKTQNRNKLKTGDRIVFYKAGKQGKKFLGTASLSTNLMEDSPNFTVGLTDIRVWKKPIHVASIVDDLKFIKNKKSWGLYFQGGVRSISTEDFETISAKN